MLLEDRFPKIWVPSWENRDLRQLLWHRHWMVQARTGIMNQLQAVALDEGLRVRTEAWRQWPLGGRKAMFHETAKNDLTPTGLLMEGISRFDGF